APASTARRRGSPAAGPRGATAFVRTSAGAPVQDDLSALPRVPDRERLLVVLEREAVRDDRRDVETRLHEDGHLVPGLEDLPAVDASDREHLEDHLRPVD